MVDFLNNTKRADFAYNYVRVCSIAFLTILAIISFFQINSIYFFGIFVGVFFALFIKGAYLFSPIKS